MDIFTGTECHDILGTLLSTLGSIYEHRDINKTDVNSLFYIIL